MRKDVSRKERKEYLKQQSHEQLEIFILNDELIEKSLRRRLYILSGCDDFGGQDSMNGCCVDCCLENSSLWERCNAFSKTIDCYVKNVKD